MKTHTIEQAVRYIETDRMKVVHHSTYLAWFEVGRTSLLASAGFPYAELEASGILFPVIEYTCRMTGKADYGDTVRIETSIASLKNRTVHFSYRAFNGHAQIATGETRHVAVDANMKPRRMPEPLLQALAPFISGDI